MIAPLRASEKTFGAELSVLGLARWKKGSLALYYLALPALRVINCQLIDANPAIFFDSHTSDVAGLKGQLARGELGNGAFQRAAHMLRLNDRDQPAGQFREVF
jgi:hypothetical protein